MGMTPSDIYQSILEQTGIVPVTLCDLHKRCKKTRCCSKESKVEQLDFDTVKKLWCKKNGKASCRSVDGLTYNADTLFLVEMKGTWEFIHYQENSYENIDKQINSYELQAKCLDSVGICENMTQTEQLCKLMHVVFLLVTDVDPEKDPLRAFAESLDMLATTSTNWEKVYTDSLAERLDKEMVGLSDIKSHFVFCKRIDDYINQ